MLLLLFGVVASLQQVQTGFLDRSITVGNRAYHYQVYVPADYASKPTWPAEAHGGNKALALAFQLRHDRCSTFLNEGTQLERLTKHAAGRSKTDAARAFRYADLSRFAGLRSGVTRREEQDRGDKAR